MAASIGAAGEEDYPAEIACVVSNVAGAPGVKIARDAGIATAVIPDGDYPDRETFDRAVSAELEKHGVRLVALAGFLRVLSPWFPERWNGRVVNIHPSLLPAFPGLHVHQQQIDAGVRASGCTVHFVIPDLDAGPIIGQAAVPVLASDHGRHAGCPHPAPGAILCSSAGVALDRRGPSFAEGRTGCRDRGRFPERRCSSRPIPKLL